MSERIDSAAAKAALHGDVAGVAFHSDKGGEYVV